MEQVTVEENKPCGKRIRANHLNDLAGKEWMKFTKSWFTLGAKPRDRKICHPASFPETLAAEFISFFTKEKQWVLDPFLGTGSSLMATKILGRNGLGIELYSKYLEIAKERLGGINESNSNTILRCADSRNLVQILNEEGVGEVDFCITSPPYWNQLNKNNRRQKIRKMQGLDTTYGDLTEDLGGIENYKTFLKEQKKIFDKVYLVTKKGGYLVIITNNVYRDGKVWPLAFDTFNSIGQKWTPKDERIWCQNDKALFPFGIFDTYVGNRNHHYCLIFKKENHKKST